MELFENISNIQDLSFYTRYIFHGIPYNDGIEFYSLVT